MHYIFDLDGTLIDSVPDIRHNINLLLGEEGLKPLSLEETTSFVGNGSRKLVERAFTHFDKAPETEAELDDLSARFISHYMANLTDNTIIYPHVIETLHALKKAGHHLSLCTNKPIEPTLAILKDFDLFDLFSVVTGGDSYIEKKPHPMPISKTIEQVGLSKDKCIMVGDSIYDMQAGQAAGISTILVTYGYMHGKKEEIEATYIIDNFNHILTLT